MALETQWIRFGEDGRYSGYLAREARAQGPLPGVVVLQEAWGVDEHIEDVTRRLAQAGYVALAPELFARDGARPRPLEAPRLAELRAFFDELPPGKGGDETVRAAALATRPADAQARLTETMGTLFGRALRDTQSNLEPTLAAAAHLRASLSQGRGVAAVGFCMGGGVAGLAACRDPELSGAAIFYGMAPPAEEIAKLRSPLIAFHAASDERLVEGLPAFAAAMRAHGQPLETHVYEGAQHAFLNDTRPSYDARASRLSWARLLGFLVERIGQ